MDGLTEGRIVHFVMPDGNFAGEHRPAIIVNAWHNNSVYQQEGRVNLQVFTDFGNDGKAYESGRYWATSVPYSEEPKPGTWHWIEFAGQQKPKPVVDWVAVAQDAYDAYGGVTDHKNYQGLPMPAWEALTEKIQQAWIAAVKNVYQRANPE